MSSIRYLIVELWTLIWRHRTNQEVYVNSNLYAKLKKSERKLSIYSHYGPTSVMEISLVVFYDENARLNTTVKVGFVTISSDSESVSCSSVSSLSVSSSSLSVVSSHYLPETDGGWKHFNCLRRAALNWSSILSVFSKSSWSVSTLVSSHRRRYPDSLSQTSYITALRLQIANSGELLTDKMDWYELVDGATGLNMI